MAKIASHLPLTGALRLEVIIIAINATNKAGIQNNTPKNGVRHKTPKIKLAIASFDTLFFWGVSIALLVKLGAAAPLI